MKIRTKEEYESWGNGILLGIIGGVAGGLVVTFGDKLYVRIAENVNYGWAMELFIFILGLAFLRAIFVAFAIKIENYDRLESIDDDREHNQVFDSLFLYRFLWPLSAWIQRIKSSINNLMKIVLRK